VTEWQERIRYMRKDAAELQLAHQRVNALINRLAGGEDVTADIVEEARHSEATIAAAMHHWSQRAQSWRIAKAREERNG
jgi:hypothetical protein